MEKPKQKQLLEPVVGCVRVMWLGKRVRKGVRGAFVCRLSVMRPELTTSTALNFCQRGRGPLWESKRKIQLLTYIKKLWHSSELKNKLTASSAPPMPNQTKIFLISAKNFWCTTTWNWIIITKSWCRNRLTCPSHLTMCHGHTTLSNASFALTEAQLMCKPVWPRSNGALWLNLQFTI